jgi:hypothetical protein
MEHNFAIPNKAISSMIFKDQTGFDLYIREGVLVISGELDKEQAKELLDAHDGSTPELSVSEKLASVGLSIDDLKAALGL